MLRQDRENDELFVSMVDDTTEREVAIPAAFMLGKNGSDQQLILSIWILILLRVMILNPQPPAP